MNVHTFFDTQNEIHIIYLMCDFKLIFTINESVGILSKFNNVSISFYICAHNYESTLVTKMKKKNEFFNYFAVAHILKLILHIK